MERCELDDLAGGYVLGVLEPEERRSFADHLQLCPPCALRVAELEPVAEDLAAGVAAHAPPPALRRRVLSAVRAEVRASQPATIARAAPRRLFAVPAARRLGAIAAVLLLVAALGGWNFSLRADLASAETRVGRLYDAMAIMGRADRWWYASGTSVAPQAGSSLAYSGADESACLLLWNMSRSEGKYLYAWVLRGGAASEPVRVRGAGSTLWGLLPGRLHDADAVVVTLEDGERPIAPGQRVVVRLPLTP